MYHERSSALREPCPEAVEVGVAGGAAAAIAMRNPNCVHVCREHLVELRCRALGVLQRDARDGHQARVLAAECGHPAVVGSRRVILDLGVEAGVIDKSGAWYSCGKERIGQGRENAKLYLKDNVELAAEVEKKVKAHLGIGPVETPETPAPDSDSDE